MATNKSGFQVGDRVIFETDTDVYPHAIISKGEQGTVTVAGDDFNFDPFAVVVKLDTTHDGLASWDNEYHWNPGNWAPHPAREQTPFKVTVPATCDMCGKRHDDLNQRADIPLQGRDAGRCAWVCDVCNHG